MSTKKKCSILIDENLYKEIENFKFENRYKSFSAAVSDLLNLGIKEILKQQNQDIEKNKYSCK